MDWKTRTLVLVAFLMIPATALAQLGGGPGAPAQPADDYGYGQPAQPAPPPPQPAPAMDAPAPLVGDSQVGLSTESPAQTGFLLQARMQTQQGVLSILSGVPGFVLGYQSGQFTLGVGLSLNRLSVDMESDVVTATILELVPTIFYDIWRSTDGRTRVNIVGAIGYGSASVDVEEESCDYYGDCETETTTTSATLIPLHVGVGGDHFLVPNFALGAELGIQALFASGLESDGHEIDGSLEGQVMYGLVRVSLLID